MRFLPPILFRVQQKEGFFQHIFSITTRSGFRQHALDCQSSNVFAHGEPKYSLRSPNYYYYPYMTVVGTLRVANIMPSTCPKWNFRVREEKHGLLPSLGPYLTTHQEWISFVSVVVKNELAPGMMGHVNLWPIRWRSHFVYDWSQVSTINFVSSRNSRINETQFFRSSLMHDFMGSESK